MTNIKLVCFDLDDTLIRGIHSVMYLCKINGKLDELIEIEKREADGEFNWIEADYHKAKLVIGLSESEVYSNFDKTLEPMKNVKSTINKLNTIGIKCILITAGPKQVAKVASEAWDFDGFFGSHYETDNKIFTGNILEHLGDKGKISCLLEYCESNNFRPEQCVAVGDGASDIPLFEYCGTSIALNYCESIIGKATHYLKSDDLNDLLEFIVETNNS